MGQRTAADRMLSLDFVSSAGLGSLPAFTAVAGYLAWLPISLATTAVAWWVWSPGNRRAFLALAAGCLSVGGVIHFLPHTADGGVDGVGLLLTVVAVGVEGYLLVGLVRRESAGVG